MTNSPCKSCGSKQTPLHTNGLCGNCYPYEYKGRLIEVIDNVVTIKGCGQNLRMPYLNGLTEDEKLNIAKEVIDLKRATYLIRK